MDAYMTRNLIEFGVGLSMGALFEVGSKYLHNIPYIGEVFSEDSAKLGYSPKRIISTGVSAIGGGGVEYLLSGNFGLIPGVFTGARVGGYINILKKRSFESKKLKGDLNE